MIAEKEKLSKCNTVLSAFAVLSPYQLLCPSLPGDPQCQSASSPLNLYILAPSLCHSQRLMSSRHLEWLTLASFGYWFFLWTNKPANERYLMQHENWPICLFVERAEEYEVLQSSATKHETEMKVFYKTSYRQNLRKNLAARGKSHWKNIGCIAWKKTITNWTSWEGHEEQFLSKRQVGNYLQGGEILLPPEVGLHPGAECSTEVVEVHQSMDSWHTTVRWMTIFFFTWV